jgi:hypothetical protein
MELQTQDTNAALSLFDPKHYTTIADIANMMAATNTTPETLRGERKGQNFTPFAIEEVKANCFMVAEQAMRWGLSPFACAQHASIVRGKLMWEGKLVAAVLDQLTGVRLKYDYTGSGVNRKVTVSGKFADETEVREVTGLVKDWKTAQWTETNYDQRLAYRGAREWSRRHAPSAMLGITTSDEELKKPAARDVTPLREDFVDPTKFQAIEETPVVKESLTAEEPKKDAPPINEVECVIEDYTLDEEAGLHIVTLTTGENTVEAKTSDSKIGGLCDFNKGGNVIAGLQQTKNGIKLTSIEIV